MTMKPQTLPSEFQGKLLCNFHAIRTNKFTMNPPARQHAIHKKVVNSPHQRCPHSKILLAENIIGTLSINLQPLHIVNQGL